VDDAEPPVPVDLRRTIGHEPEDGWRVTSSAGPRRATRSDRRVVEAVVAGTVAEDPVVERAPTDRPCPFCSAPIEVSYQQERVEMCCPDCPGVLRHENAGEQFDADPGSFSHLENMSLPPTGPYGRTPTEVLQAAQA
jgi:hypothetical protein